MHCSQPTSRGDCSSICAQEEEPELGAAAGAAAGVLEELSVDAAGLALSDEAAAGVEEESESEEDEELLLA